jgi:AcrR family transcriptional regulator
MGRPREFDPDQALDRATRLFWERGYEATSIQDLVDTLGISRASLYGTFGDKPHLFEKVLARYSERVTVAQRQALDAPSSGRAAIAAYFSALIEAATRPRSPHGCLILNTVTGCTTLPEPLLARMSAAIAGTHEQVRAALARDPALARRADLPDLASFVMTQGLGFGVLAKAGARRQELERAAEAALRLLDAKTATA